MLECFVVINCQFRNLIFLPLLINTRCRLAIDMNHTSSLACDNNESEYNPEAPAVELNA